MRRPKPKCDPDYGWEVGPGGKCVRAKPKQPSGRRVAGIALGGGLVLGAGLALGATALMRQSSASKQQAASVADSTRQVASATQKFNQDLGRLDQEVAQNQERAQKIRGLLPGSKSTPVDLPPDTAAANLGKARAENDRLRSEQEKLIQERDQLSKQLEETEKAAKEHRQSLAESRRKLSELESGLEAQSQSVESLRISVAQQEKALQSLTKDLVSRDREIGESQSRTQQVNQERSQSVVQGRSAGLKTDRLKSKKDDVEAELGSTRNLLKRTEADLAESRQSLADSQERLGKARQELEQARARVKRIEDALLVVPALKPGLIGNRGKRKAIDPDTLDLTQKPDRDRRRASLKLSLENSRLQLEASQKQQERQRKNQIRREVLGKMIKRRLPGRKDSLRLDRQKPKCDPDYGWEVGPGGKCVRVKPDQNKKIAAIAGGTGLALGAGLVLGATALNRHSDRLKTEAQQSAQRVSQAAATVNQVAQKVESVGEQSRATKDLGSQYAQRSSLEQGIRGLIPSGKDPIAPPSPTSKLQRAIESDNEALRRGQADLIRERDDLSRRISEAEQTLEGHRQSLEKSSRSLNALGSNLDQEAATAGRLRRTLEEQEKALQSLSSDLEKRSQALAAQKQKEVEAIAARDRAVTQRQSSQETNDRLTRETESATADLVAAQKALKESRQNLQQTRKELAQTASAIQKVGEQHQKAQGRITELEDALLSNPIQRPGFVPKRRVLQAINPATLTPADDPKRRRAIDQSLANADRHLAQLRGEADPDRRGLLKVPVDYAKRQVGEIDPDRVEIVKSAGRAARRKFEEGMRRELKPVAPSNSEEAKRTLEKIADGHIKEVSKKAVPGWIELAIPGPNGKRAADLYRFAMADKGMAGKVERWSKEMEAAMKNPDPVSRREWMERFRNKVFEETLSSRSNIEKTTGTIGEIGESIGDRARGVKIEGQGYWEDRARPDNPLATWRNKVPKGQKLVPMTFGERLADSLPFIGKGRVWKRVADKRASRQSSMIARFVRDLMFRKDSDHPVAPSDLSRLLRIDSASSHQILEGKRPFTAREIGIIRAEYGLPAIFEPNDPLSTQILLSGLRQDARTCKSPWEGVLGKCRRKKEEDTEPPGRKAAKATLLAGAAVGLGLAGLGAYAASRPMPPRPAPPDISPGRPRPTPPQPPKSGKTPPTPPTPPAPKPPIGSSDYDQYQKYFEGSGGKGGRSVLAQAWQRVTGRGGTRSPSDVLTEALKEESNVSSAWDKYRAYTIADRLNPAILKEAFDQEAKRRESVAGTKNRPPAPAPPYDGKTLFAVAAIGDSDNAGQTRLQQQFWQRLKDPSPDNPVKANGREAGQKDRLLAIAKEVRFASETQSGFSLEGDQGTQFLRSARGISFADNLITAKLRQFTPDDTSPPARDFAREAQGLKTLKLYPFLQAEDYQGAVVGKNTKALRTKLSDDSFEALKTWEDMKFNRSDPYHGLLRDPEKGLLTVFANTDFDKVATVARNRENDLKRTGEALVRLRRQGKPPDHPEVQEVMKIFFNPHRKDSKAECDPDHGWKDGPGKCVRAKAIVEVKRPSLSPAERERFRFYRSLQQQQIDEEENRIAGLPHEEAMILSPGGKVARFAGDKQRIHLVLPQEERKIFEMGVVTHNHPSGGSFSPADFKTLCNMRLHEIRAVTADHTHIIRRSPSASDLSFHPQDADERVQLFSGSYTNLLKRSTLSYRSGKVSLEEANHQLREGRHKIWQKIAERYDDMEYIREDRKK